MIELNVGQDYIHPSQILEAVFRAIAQKQPTTTTVTELTPRC